MNEPRIIPLPLCRSCQEAGTCQTGGCCGGLVVSESLKPGEWHHIGWSNAPNRPCSDAKE